MLPYRILQASPEIYVSAQTYGAVFPPVRRLLVRGRWALHADDLIGWHEAKAQTDDTVVGRRYHARAASSLRRLVSENTAEEQS
jgi:hypothetical protein